MDINARIYFAQLQRLGFEVEEITYIKGFLLKLWRQYFRFYVAAPPINNISAAIISNNKFRANKVLESGGMPVPKAAKVTWQEFKEDSWDLAGLKFPVVIKPTLGGAGGHDVLCNIKNMEILKKHMKEKFRQYTCLSIEEFYGNLPQYRVLVLGNKVLGVTLRIPAEIIGDGKHTISELIDFSNRKREEFLDFVSLGAIKIDEEFEIRMAELGITPDYIPKAEEKIRLCYGCNSTRGGTMVSLGKQLHKENAKLCCEAAKLLGLELVGFDIICKNINVPIKKSGGVIIEANCSPDITIHENPISGIANNVSKEIIKKFFKINYSLYLLDCFSRKAKKCFKKMGFAK